MKWKLSISHIFLSQQQSDLAEFPLTNGFTVGLLIEVIGQSIQSAERATFSDRLQHFCLLEVGRKLLIITSVLFQF